jgi:PAS domain S-box-containing protein
MAAVSDRERIAQREEELESTRLKLHEAESTLTAIREDRVDALVISGPRGEEIRTILSMGTLGDSMFNQVSQPVFILDEANLILRANPPAHHLCGSDPELRYFSDALPLRPVSVGGGAAEILFQKDLAPEGIVEALDVVYSRPDGETRYFLLDMSHVSSDADRFRGRIVTMMDTTTRKRNEIRIAVSNEQLRYQFRLTQSVTDNAAEALILMDVDHRIAFVNPSASRMLGLREEQIAGRVLSDVVHLQCERRPQADGPRLLDLLAPGQAARKFRATLIASDDDHIPVHCSFSPVTEGDEIRGSVLVMSDISDQIKAEQALRESVEKQRQSQKMEAIGRLAGGIAHDFNNLLQVVLGFADLSMQIAHGDEDLSDNLMAIQKAGERAMTLTAQLLAYSRKQRLATRVCSLKEVVADIEHMIRALVGESVSVDLDMRGEDLQATIDREQLQQVIINLVLNANDAMPDGGILSIRTHRMALEPKDLGGFTVGPARGSDEGLSPGEYGVIEVGDTGHGMNEQVKERLFEPFFTTKEVGRGSGLGLPTAYGIVRQMGGSIQVSSAEGQGSVFRVLLPLSHEKQAAVPGHRRHKPSTPVRGTETILLVEDEESIRALLVRVLSSAGYVVLEAANGVDALRLISTYEGPLDLLVTDVKMEKMGGRELSERLEELRPRLRTLFMSGYSEERINRAGASRQPPAFIAKPFRSEDLLRAVRSRLDEGNAGSSLPMRS